MSTWEERMSLRAKSRMVIAEAEQAAYEAATYAEAHIHGNGFACPCGAALPNLGCLTVIIPGGFIPPNFCSECGRPFGEPDPAPDYQRPVDRHARGCPRAT